MATVPAIRAAKRWSRMMLDQGFLPAPTGNRFERLLDAGSHSQPIWNTVLTETPDYVVVPTLGSIVPSWHLVIPRVASLNIHEHLTTLKESDIRKVLAPVVQARRFGQVLWFEHGPRHAGSVVGCGTDYAHLHVVLDSPFSISEFHSAAQEFLPSWTTHNTGDAYSKLCPSREYYAFGNLQSAFVSYADTRPTSQLFRKVIARLVGKQHEWDYRQYDHEGCVRQTIEQWGMN